MPQCNNCGSQRLRHIGQFGKAEIRVYDGDEYVKSYGDEIEETRSVSCDECGSSDIDY